MAEKPVVPYLNAEQVGTFQDRIIVYPDPAIEKTKGGILIPDTAKEKPKRGTVVLVGNEIRGLEIGNRVLYGNLSGQKFNVGDTEYVAVRPSECMLSFANWEAEQSAIKALEEMKVKNAPDNSPQTNRSTLTV